MMRPLPIAITLALVGCHADGRDELVPEIASCSPLPPAAITASGDDGHVAANAIDGKPGTRWSNLGAGSWLQIDLGAPQDICGVRIAWYQGGSRRNNFTIAISADATTWTDVASGQSSGTTSDFEATDVPITNARYLRITVNGNTQNQWASISEVEVLGSSDDGGGGGGGGGDVAPDGTRAIFPSKPGGLWNTNADVRFFTRHYQSGKPDDPTVEVTLEAPSGHQQDIEATAIVTLVGMKHDDTIDWKIRGPSHSDGNGKAWYALDQDIFGAATPTLQVERPHPKMHDNSSKTTRYVTPPNLATRTFGWKGITVNKAPGDVYIAAWINLTPFDASGAPNPEGWQKLWDVHDTGQISSGQITPPTGGHIQIRIDGIKGHPTFQLTSIREIDYAEASATAQ